MRKLFNLVLILATLAPWSDLLATPSSKPVKILFLGDSLTEGHGVAKEAAFPALVEARLVAASKKPVQLTAAGIGGSTSASGPARLRWHLKNKPDILILALGGNDGLRGISVAELRKNLAATIELARANQITVLLAGMKMPPNYGPKYTQDFAKTFADLARQYDVALIPFLLEGVGGDPKLNLPDGIHPNEAGHKIIAETVYKHLVPLL